VERADGSRQGDGFAVTPVRVLADHISGMTDRYAFDCYRRLFL
jgi:dGTP triphosphohydrolase